MKILQQKYKIFLPETLSMEKVVFQAWYSVILFVVTSKLYRFLTFPCVLHVCYIYLKFLDLIVLSILGEV
jgi:hypothetical protein